MTREEEIQKEAIETRCAIATSLSGDNYSSIDDLPFVEGKISYDELVEKAFIRGAEWSDRHPAKKPTAIIYAWVARDRDTNLYVYDKKPYKFINEWLPDETGCTFLKVDCTLFQEVTFKNSPKKVKVTIELEDEQ